VSIAIAPSVDWLHRHGLQRSLSVILIYLLLLTLFIGAIFLLAPPILDQLTATVPKLDTYYQSLKSSLGESSLLALRQIAAQMPAQLSLISSVASTPAATDSLDTVGQALGTMGAVVGMLFTVTAVLLIGFYWTLEGESAIKVLLMLVPSSHHVEIREVLHEIEMRVGGYVRGQGIMVLAICAADFVIFLLLGLPAALAVALLAGLFEVVPVLGPTLGAIPAVLVAFSYDSSKVIWVIVAGAIVQFFENNLLAPRVMHKTVGVNPIVTLLAIVAFSALFGFVGLLLAIPIAAIVQIILDRSLLRPQASGLEVPQGRDRLSRLRFDVQDFIVDVRSIALHKDTGSVQSEVDPVEDILEGIALALDGAILTATAVEGDA
jgi:predicted PurR-regulated permease PerM